MNLLSDAKVEIERGIALDPTDSQCYVQYAIVLRDLKDHEQLIFCCSKLIELGTERNYALINRAKSLAALGRTQDALKDFDTIISESLPSAEAALKAKAIIS
jgi:tetratricopeptide (TPR) repeat protein